MSFEIGIQHHTPCPSVASKWCDHVHALSVLTDVMGKRCDVGVEPQARPRAVARAGQAGIATSAMPALRNQPGQLLCLSRNVLL